MNILSFFIIVPLLMLAGLWASRSVNQVRGVMVTGASLLLALSVYLTIDYIGLRQAGAMEEMLFTDSISWYAPLHICYSIGVDGISVAMLLLSAIIVFTGTFASWKLQPLTKEYFLWFLHFSAEFRSCSGKSRFLRAEPCLPQRKRGCGCWLFQKASPALFLQRDGKPPRP